MALALLRSPAHLAPTTPVRETESRPQVDRLPRGRIVELAGDRAPARYTAAVEALLHAQAQGETAAWIEREDCHVFPPDLAEAGVDLDALVFVRVPAAGKPHDLARAAEILLRSGGFGFVAIDFTACGAPRGDAWAARVVKLARAHEAWVLALTGATGLRFSEASEVERDPSDPEGSLSALVGMRVVTTRNREPVAEARQHPSLRARQSFSVAQRVAKNKTGVSVGDARLPARGPSGAR